MSHSPFPWSTHPQVPTGVYDGDGMKVAVAVSMNAEEDAALIAAIPAMVEALERLTNANALQGVRQVVAGWNGEGRSEPFEHRHPDDLGATLPKTTCGAVYDLDDALQAARAVLASLPAPTPAPTDIERAFQDACDEAGCTYDNEALLEAISALKAAAAPTREETMLKKLADDCQTKAELLVADRSKTKDQIVLDASSSFRWVADEIDAILALKATPAK